uniref:Uncharacterized protein n=1 Tax=Tetradesmus obliquus TaxID=3088 RepID=A0A383VH34_TETOB|eukprot:jgi/Sobl393_1/16186/SZX63994.1
MRGLAGAIASTDADSITADGVLQVLQIFGQACSLGAEAASSITRMWKQTAQFMWLQRPIKHCSAKQALVLDKTTQATAKLKNAFDTAVSSLHLYEEHGVTQPIQKFLDCTLASHPVLTLAQLLVWLQRQPELLQLPASAAAHGSSAAEASSSSSSSSRASSSSSSSSSRASSSRASSSSASVTIGEVWLACTTALVAVLDCALMLEPAECATEDKTHIQLGEELIRSGLPRQLPHFLWQATKLLAASGQPVVCGPMAAALKLLRAMTTLLTLDSSSGEHGFDFSVAEDTVQQLLN